MFDEIERGIFVAFYVIKQDMLIENYHYKNVYNMIPALLKATNYPSAREEALSKRGKNIMLVSVEEITDKQKELILRFFGKGGYKNNEENN